MPNDSVQRLIHAAKTLLEAREDQMVTPVEWDALRDAVQAMDPPTTPWFVSTLARYVVVDATDETDAKTKGCAALYDLCADIRAREGRDVPVTIHTVRPATPVEVAMCALHTANMDREAKL